MNTAIGQPLALGPSDTTYLSVYRNEFSSKQKNVQFLTYPLSA